MRHRAWPVSGVAIVCLALCEARPRAQEMEPNAYSAAAVGANFFVASYSWSTGSVLFDASLPLVDVHADVQGLGLGLGHTFNLFGRLGLVTAAIPYAHAAITGQVSDRSGAVTRSGLADARARLSVNLRGNPAMRPAEFAVAPRRPIVGASLTVTAPSGEYDRTRLINIGSNRWFFKPEVGVSLPKGRWTLDSYVGAWLYTSNDAFYPGRSVRSQDPVVAIQGHASYTVRPRLWIAADGTWYHGGRVRVDDGEASSGLSNSRLGLTASIPIGRRYSAKVAYASGLVARTGTDFSTLAVAWQVLWLSPSWSGR